MNSTIFNGPSDFVCPTEFNSTTGEYFNYQLCGDVGSTCAIQAIPACFSNPCKNGGICQETGTNTLGYTCDCSTATEFLGFNCTADDPCLPDPCNGGTCSVTGNDANGFTYQCDCSTVADGIGQNCSTDNPCVPDPCNGGSCSVSGNDAVGYSFSCDCANVIDGIGETCSQDNPCEPNPCNNGGGGTCQISGTDPNFSFTCDCSTNDFTGAVCRDNPCDPNPCNNGSCSVSGNDADGYNFSCDCLNVSDGIGQLCSVDDPCVPNPCNGGTCTVSGSDPNFDAICSGCPAGFSGDRCQIPDDPCDENSCENGGQCAFAGTPGEFTCSCPSPWLGARCTIKDECAAEQPCMNDGMCFTRSNGSYFCECVNNWAGANCTQHPNIGVSCGTSSMLITLEKAVFDQLLAPTETLHLIDPACTFNENGLIAVFELIRVELSSIMTYLEHIKVILKAVFFGESVFCFSVFFWTSYGLLYIIV